MGDKLRILKMVEEGKITGEEAEKLLDAMKNDTTVAKVEDDFFKRKQSVDGKRMLYIRVKSQDGEKVNISIPVEIIKMATSFTGAGLGKLDKYDIDFDMIMNAIDKNINGPIIQIDTEDGDKVTIEIS